MPRAVILTSRIEEYSAVQSHLTEPQEIEHPQGTIYERGYFTANGQQWEILIAEIEAGNEAAALEAERAISHFNPSVLLFIGVAGGIKNVKLGDVVVADKVYGYESGKAAEEFYPIPEARNTSYKLLQRAKAEARNKDKNWLKRLTSPNLTVHPQVVVDPIASGQKLIVSNQSSEFQFLRANYEDAIAVESGGFGCLQTAKANEQLFALIIRGISYLINIHNISDEQNWTEIAARHASAFAFEILAKFKVEQNDINQQITGIHSNIKQVEKQINIEQLANSISSNLDSNLSDERHKQIDYASKLIKRGQLKQALDYLTDLKNELFHKADDKIKYRLLAQIGMIQVGLDYVNEGASNLIAARQYNPDDETAVTLAARGHILHKQYEQAEALIQKTLEKNPANTLAYSLRVDMADKTASINEILDKIPEPYRNNSDVLIALGKAAIDRKLHTKAEEWFQSAINLAEGYVDNLKVYLGTIILEPVTQDYPLIAAGQLTEINKCKLERAINLFTEFLQGTLSNSEDLSPLELTTLTNRSGAFRLLGKYDESIRDIELVLQREPDNAYCIKQRAILAHQKGDEEQAYQFSQKILASPETPEASILAASSLIALNRFTEAQKVLEAFQQIDGNEKLKQEAKRLQAEIFLQLNDLKNAQKLIEDLLNKAPENTDNLIFQIRLENIINKENISYDLIEKAKNALLLNPSFPTSWYLAEELYYLKYYRDAAEIYEQFVDKTLDNKLTHSLLNSYYYSGNCKAALKLCQELLEKYSALQYASEMAAFLYEDIGDLPSSLQVCENYLKQFPDDQVMQLRLAWNNYLMENYIEVDRFFDTNPSINNLSLENCFCLARLYKFRQRINNFLEVIYEMRRSFYNEDKVHIFYTVSYMEIQKQKPNNLNIKQVVNNCGVLLKDTLNNEQWYILDDRNDADLAKYEINSTQTLYRNLMGKKIGDIVIKSENFLGQDTLTIVAIQDKYFAAGKHSFDLLEKLPDLQDFQVVHVPTRGDNIAPEWLKKFDEMLQYKEDNFDKRQIDYQQGKIPFGLFANIIDRNPIELWEMLVYHSNSSIHTWSNFNNEKFEDSLTILQKGGFVVIDPISLLTIHQLEIANEVIQGLGKLGIAQSTIYLFQNIIEQTKGWEADGFATVGIRDKQRFFQEFTPEQVAQKRIYFEQIIQWINNNCYILPCWRALDIDKDKREQLNQIIGSAFVDTILIAGESGRILYSDDQWLRWYAHADSGVRGVWTQAVLKYCQEKEYLDEDKYNKATLRLILLGYNYTRINANILLLAVKQAQWKIDFQYRSALQVLSYPSLELDSVASVAAEFIYKLYQEVAIPTVRDPLIFELLKAITTERSQWNMIQKLNKFIKKRFTWLPLNEPEVLQLVKIWQDCQLIIT